MRTEIEYVKPFYDMQRDLDCIAEDIVDKVHPHEQLFKLAHKYLTACDELVAYLQDLLDEHAQT